MCRTVASDTALPSTRERLEVLLESWGPREATSLDDRRQRRAHASDVTLPEKVSAELAVPGIRLFSSTRALALAGWLAGLEPVRLEISGPQLVLEAGLEDRWLLTNLPTEEAEVATAAFAGAREQAGGLQFLAVQASEQDQRFEGFWLLRDLPDA